MIFLLLIALIVCFFAIAFSIGDIRFLLSFKNDSKQHIDSLTPYEIFKSEKIISICVFVYCLFILILLFVIGYSDHSFDRIRDDMFFLIAPIIIIFASLIHWLTVIKEENVNSIINAKLIGKEPTISNTFQNVSKYASLIISAIISIILICAFIPFVFAEDFLVFKYKSFTNFAKDIYEEKQIPMIEKEIRSANFPDLDITINECFYKEKSLDDLPIYEVDFNYYSKKIDDYYDYAMKSEKNAKELFYMILEVNAEKNRYEDKNTQFDIDNNKDIEKIIVHFNEADRFEMTIKGNYHTYTINNQKYYDALHIDGTLVYERKKEGPSDSHSKNDKPTYETKPNLPSSNHSSSNSSNDSKYDGYNDGYNSVVEDGDYDYDRYEDDDEYRNGVDDALNEMGEDY